MSDDIYVVVRDDGQYLCQSVGGVPDMWTQDIRDARYYRFGFTPAPPRQAFTKFVLMRDEAEFVECDDCERISFHDAPEEDFCDDCGNCSLHCQCKANWFEVTVRVRVAHDVADPEWWDWNDLLETETQILAVKRLVEKPVPVEEVVRDLKTWANPEETA